MAWLQDFIEDAVERNLCCRIYCTTCGATEFREGLLHAAAKASGGQIPPRRSLESSAFIARALAEVQPPSGGVGYAFRRAVHMIVSELDGALLPGILGEALGDSWAGGVQADRVAHHRERVAERRAREAYNRPEKIAERREARVRLKQTRHAERLRLKLARDRAWRQAHPEAPPARHPVADGQC